MKEARGPWYLLTGLVIGLALGLTYAWVIQPVNFYDTPPHTLNASDKAQYRLMIAQAYAADGDLVRAYERLKLLKDANVGDLLVEQAQQLIAADGAVELARALNALADALANAPELTGAQSP